MNKTKIILIASLAAAGVVGTTVAAFVVDNANEQGMLISPGNISIDTDKVYTLSWGSLGEGQTALANLPNVIPGKEYTYYVKVVASEDYKGLFSYKLEDKTVRTEDATHKLIDAISVDFSYGDEAATTWTIPDASSSYSGSRTINAGPSGVLIKMVVKIDIEAQEYWSDISSDLVRFSVNWDKATADSEYTGTSFYVKTPSAWMGNTVYAYAFNAEGTSINAAWPGVTMNKISGSYQALIDTSKYTKVIFSDGSHQTVDLALDASKPYYTIEETATGDDGKYSATASTEFSDTSYYVVGTFNTWTINNAYKMSKADGETYYSWTGEIAANSDYKVLSSLNEWIGGDLNNANIGDAGTYKISLDLSGKAFGGDEMSGDNAIYNYVKAEAVTA